MISQNEKGADSKYLSGGSCSCGIPKVEDGGTYVNSKSHTTKQRYRDSILILCAVFLFVVSIVAFLGFACWTVNTITKLKSQVDELSQRVQLCEEKNSLHGVKNGGQPVETEEHQLLQWGGENKGKFELPKIFGKPDNYESKEDSLDDKIVGPGEKLVEIIKSRRRRDAEQPAGKRRRGSKTRSKKRCPRKCQGAAGPPGPPGPEGPQGPQGPPGLSTLSKVALYQGNVESILTSRVNCDRYNAQDKTFSSCDGRFMHWQKSEWMSKDKDDFHMNHNGNLSVKEPGIYFIFGQVMFYNPSPFNTVGIFVNGKNIARCTQSLPQVDADGDSQTNAKYHTCWLGTAWHVKAHDQITLRHFQHNRVVDMRPGRTYFGIIKLADVPSNN